MKTVVGGRNPRGTPDILSNKRNQKYKKRRLRRLFSPTVHIYGGCYTMKTVVGGRNPLWKTQAVRGYVTDFPPPIEI